jgi:hypothetical protein
MTVTNKIEKLFMEYAAEYNKSGDSEETEKAFEKLSSATFDTYTPEENEEVLNILCTLDHEGKIDISENLFHLESR